MNTSDLQKIKQRYNVVGNCEALNHALDIALKVAPIDLSVLIIGESGVGKEIIPRIIHDNSPRKRVQYLREQSTVNSSDTRRGLLQEQ